MAEKRILYAVVRPSLRKTGCAQPGNFLKESFARPTIPYGTVDNCPGARAEGMDDLNLPLFLAD